MKNKKERLTRARAMNKKLARIFPKETRTELVWRAPWQLLVAVILSAQCTDKKVNEVTKGLFKKYKTLCDIAHSSQAQFEKDIYSTGFFKTKAKNIRAMAKIVCQQHKGKIPNSMEGLCALPGVARKTANVVLINAFGKIEGVPVDTHVKRFAIRFNLTDNTNPEKIEEDLMQLLPKKEWGNFSNRLIVYGRRICPAKKHPCAIHPLTAIYPTAQKRWPRS